MPRHKLKPRAKFDAKGRVLIPEWIRKRMGIKKGTFVEIEVYGDKGDKILLMVLRK